MTWTMWFLSSPSLSASSCNNHHKLYSLTSCSLDSEVNSDTAAAFAAAVAASTAGDLGFRPPSGFIDSREFSEAECDREQRALDLEVQRVMENNDGHLQKMDREELTSLLAR